MNIIAHRAPGEMKHEQLPDGRWRQSYEVKNDISSFSRRASKLMQWAPLVSAMLGLGVEHAIRSKASVTSVMPTLHPFSKRMIEKMGRAAWLFDFGVGYGLNRVICRSGRAMSSYALSRIVDPGKPSGWREFQWNTGSMELGQDAIQYRITAGARIALPYGHMLGSLYQRRGIGKSLWLGIAGITKGIAVNNSKLAIDLYCAIRRSYNAYTKYARVAKLKSMSLMDFVKESTHVLIGQILTSQFGLYVSAMAAQRYQSQHPARSAEEMNKLEQKIVNDTLANIPHVPLRNFLRTAWDGQYSRKGESIKTLYDSLATAYTAPYYAWNNVCDVLELSDDLRYALKSGRRSYNGTQTIDAWNTQRRKISMARHGDRNDGGDAAQQDINAAAELIDEYVRLKFGVGVSNQQSFEEDSSTDDNRQMTRPEALDELKISQEEEKASLERAIRKRLKEFHPDAVERQARAAGTPFDRDAATAKFQKIERAAQVLRGGSVKQSDRDEPEKMYYSQALELLGLSVNTQPTDLTMAELQEAYKNSSHEPKVEQAREFLLTQVRLFSLDDDEDTDAVSENVV